MEGFSLLAIVGMVLSESAQVGLMIASKEALSDGMSNLVFMFYSNAIASLILLPSSLLFHRSSQRPELTFSVVCGFFLLGLIGCGVQFLGYTGIYYSSPTLCTAMLNLVPTFTFVLAVALRMEVFHWRSLISLAKSIGTVVSLLGAFLVTFYDGPALLKTFSSYPNLFSEHSNWVFGGLLLIVVAILSSCWLIIQASILKRYPEELVIVFFYFFFVCILSAMVCLVVERDLSAWSLKSKTRLWCVLYSGAFGSAFQIGINTWCMKKAGPVFVTMFKPLGIVISIFVGVVFSGDIFYLGRILGAVIIIAGFYSVLWAKSKEAEIRKGNEMIESLESTAQHVPLLQNRSEEREVFLDK